MVRSVSLVEFRISVPKDQIAMVCGGITKDRDQADIYEGGIYQYLPPGELLKLQDEQGSDLLAFTVDGGVDREHEPFQSVPVNPVFNSIDPEAAKKKERVSLAIETRGGSISFEGSSSPAKVEKATVELTSGGLYKIVDAGGNVKNWFHLFKR